MKTSEFIKKLDEHRDEILNIENIFSEEELYLTSIKTNQFNITFYHDKEPNEIFDIIAEYLNTPVRERKEEKKYYLKLKAFSTGDIFLNFRPSNGNFFMSDKLEIGCIKTQFTQKEIDEMPEYYTHPAVWEQVLVEE